MIPYAPTACIPTLAKTYSLCVTGENAAAARDGVATRAGGGGAGGLWDFLDSVAIFARMSPDDKERVLKRLKQQGRHTFMCGDGANDVGALKQAHVGVALLSGFGGANTKKIAAPGDEKAAGGEAGGAPVVPTRAEAETFQEKMKRVRETAAEGEGGEGEGDRRAQARPGRAHGASETVVRRGARARRTSAGSSGRSSAP